MADIMKILYEALCNDILADIKTYERSIKFDRFQYQTANDMKDQRLKTNFLRECEAAVESTRRIGKKIVERHVNAENIKKRILAMESNIDLQPLPKLDFLQDQALIQLHSELRQIKEAQQQPPIQVNNYVKNSPHHEELKKVVFELKSKLKACVDRYLEVQRNRFETNKRLIEIEAEMKKFPLCEQKSDKYFQLDNQRMTFLGQLGTLNALCSRFCSEKLYKEVDFQTANSELLMYYGEKFSSDDIEIYYNEHVKFFQNELINYKEARHKLQNATTLIENLKKRELENLSKVERARQLFEQAESLLHPSEQQGTLDDLLSKYEHIKSNLNKSEENYNYILSKMRIVLKVIQRNEDKLNDTQKIFLQNQLNDSSDQIKLDNSELVAIESPNSFEQTAKIYINKLYEQRKHMQNKLMANKKTRNRMMNELVEKNVISDDAEELEFLADELNILDDEIAHLNKSFSTLNRKLLDKIKEVKEHSGQLSEEFFHYVDRLHVGLNKAINSSKIPKIVSKTFVPKLSVSKVAKPCFSKSKIPTVRGYKQKMSEAIQVLQRELINDPKKTNQCQAYVDKFYNELKTKHKKIIDCKKVVEVAERNRKIPDKMFKAQLKKLLQI